ncbi:unnamed protein product [Caenorhabditis angaria]|uniref:Methionine synthase reductase n=1 Tax=Caenorhabditis angaria TaxID=860376 RepID=A0A9P1MVU8_9PELO|nr:unnamed protein product [Caenorhabditis angaria]
MSGDFVIAYGSHTGQAETIAKGIKEKAELIGLKPRLYFLDQNEKEFNLETEKFAAIIVSSTGDGDAPDNASRFVRRINRKTLPNDFLATLNYAILGLGDSNYSSYQAIPQKIDRQLKALGATRCFERGEADDQVGLELAVEPWIEKLFGELARRFEISEENLSKLQNSQQVKLNPIKTELEKLSILEAMPQKSQVLGPKILEAEDYEYPEESIRRGGLKLREDQNLRVPIAPQNFVISSVNHEKIEKEELKDSKWQNLCKMPGVVTPPYAATIVGTTLLTSFSAAKPKREIILDLAENSQFLRYEPGDAMYIIVPNPEQEVNFILKRCAVLDIADQKCELSIDPATQKINPILPGHVNHTQTTLRHIFTTCLDIRRAPGRPLLRILAENTEDLREKRRLLELCSAQGMTDFTNFVRQAGLSLADVLFAFPGVKPPVDRLIELLPRLIPRPYSMSSYNQKRVRFVYSEMQFTAEEGRRYARKGLATDYLNSLRIGDIVQVLGKEPARFRLPPLGSNLSAGKLPLLMIGPGTGVAVFLSFCHFLRKIKLETPENFENVSRILFFGCRDIEIDGIYIEELESFVRDGILSELYICESQKNSERVQDGLKKAENLQKVLEFLEAGKNHKIFVCGDAKGMSKDVWQCFADILAEKDGISDLEAKKKMMELKKSDQYIEDVWA